MKDELKNEFIGAVRHGLTHKILFINTNGRLTNKRQEAMRFKSQEATAQAVRKAVLLMNKKAAPGKLN